MQVKTRGVLLKATKYGDHGRILKVFTEDRGMETFFVNSIKSKTAAIKPSFLQPLTLSEINYTHKNNANFQRISEYRCIPAMHRIYTEPVKLTLVVFIQEILNKCVVEKFQHPPLFHFIHNTLLHIEETESNCSLIPAAFLAKLAAVMGFAPSVHSYAEGSVLVPKEGVFEPGHNSEEQEASSLLIALGANGYDIIDTYKIQKNIRAKTLEQLNSLFAYHLPGYKTSASDKILRQVLAS